MFKSSLGGNASIRNRGYDIIVESDGTTIELSPYQVEKMLRFIQAIYQPQDEMAERLPESGAV